MIRKVSISHESRVLTTFELARRDIALIDDLPWSCVIVDEAHRVKNERSKLTVALNQFACDCRFGLTGTGASICCFISSDI